ncbi:MAG: TonB-dependent receptor, partial [Sphingomonadaceae bacterium]
YWSIDIDDQIVAEGVAGLVAAVFGPGAGPATPANCASPFASRFTFSGGPAGGGCGALTPALGQVVRARTDIVNGADVKTTGIDFLVQYSHELTSAFSFTVGSSGTYVLSYDVAAYIQQGIVLQPALEAAGKLNFQTSAYPISRFRGQAWIDASWRQHDWRLAGNYVHGYTDERPPALRIPAFYTIDFSWNLTLPNDLALNFTVFNLTDKEPGFARLDLNYDPFTANPLGRHFSFGVRKTF